MKPNAIPEKQHSQDTLGPTDKSRNLYQRMAAVMEDVKRLQKDKQVGSGNYAYKAVSDEKVSTTMRNAFIQHGLVIFPVSQTHSLTDYTRPGRGGEASIISLSTVDVVYKLVNVDNPTEFELLCGSGTGVDPQDKGVGKAQTYAMKYALMRAFLIPTGEDPDDVHNEDLQRQQQAAADAAAEASLSRAVKAMQQAPDLDALKGLWQQHKAHAAAPSFVAAKDTRKQILEAIAA